MCWAGDRDGCSQGFCDESRSVVVHVSLFGHVAQSRNAHIPTHTISTVLHRCPVSRLLVAEMPSVHQVPRAGKRHARPRSAATPKGRPRHARRKLPACRRPSRRRGTRLPACTRRLLPPFSFAIRATPADENSNSLRLDPQGSWLNHGVMSYMICPTKTLTIKLALRVST